MFRMWCCTWYGKKGKICKMGADVPPCCPGLSADSTPCSELQWMFYSSCSIIPWQEIKTFLGRAAKRDRLSLLTQFIWPSASSCHLLSSIQGRAGARSSCGNPCSAAASAPSLSTCPCGRHQGHLTLVFRSICGHLAELCVQGRPSHTAQK